jgi:hypothetical protein
VGGDSQVLTVKQRGLNAFHHKITYFLEVHDSVLHNTIHKEKSNKIQQHIKILLLHIYMKLNMFRATHRPSSGA